MSIFLGIIVGIGLWYFWVDSESKNFLSKNNMKNDIANIRRVKFLKLYKKKHNWTKERISSIAIFLKGENISKMIYQDRISKNILVVFEDKDLVFYNENYGWKYVANEDIEDIRTEGSKKDFSLAGAIVGDMIAGGFGAAIGAMGSKEMKVHIISKNFNNKDYTLVFNIPSLIDDLANLLYKVFIFDSQPKQKIFETIKETDAYAEIVKFKELFDQGIITDEEFQTKKKELLKL